MTNDKTISLEEMEARLFDAETERMQMALHLEHLAEAMHLHAKGVQDKDSEDWAAEGEMLFMFIDRLRTIIRRQAIGTPRLCRYLGNNRSTRCVNCQ